MRIISRNEVRILAIHDDMVFMFSVDALDGMLTVYGLDTRDVGHYLDKDYTKLVIPRDGKYHKMLLKSDDYVILTQQEYTTFLANATKLELCVANIDRMIEIIHGKDENENDNN